MRVFASGMIVGGGTVSLRCEVSPVRYPWVCAEFVHAAMPQAAAIAHAHRCNVRVGFIWFPPEEMASCMDVAQGILRFGEIHAFRRNDRVQRRIGMLLRALDDRDA